MYKLLIVDDERYVREGLKTVINWGELGISVIGDAVNGLLAIELIKKEKPDLVLSDVKMPLLDGLQLSEYVSRFYPDIGVVLVSAYNDFFYAKKAIDCNVKGYLLKPVDPDEVINVFSRILGIKTDIILCEGQNLTEYDGLDASQVLIEKAARYISTHYDQKITLEEVAEYLFINPSYLSSLFKKVAGVNFIDYVSRIKVQKAKSLLKKPYYKVKDIAVKLGFNDYTYFCKVFKKFESTTPLEYRAKILLKENK